MAHEVSTEPVALEGAPGSWLALLLSSRLEIDEPPWCNLVADLEALGEPKLLELHDVGLELGCLAPDLGRELGRRDPRVTTDERERLFGPRLLSVHLGEFRGDGFHVFGGEGVLQREGHA